MKDKYIVMFTGLKGMLNKGDTGPWGHCWGGHGAVIPWEAGSWELPASRAGPDKPWLGPVASGTARPDTAEGQGWARDTGPVTPWGQDGPGELLALLLEPLRDPPRPRWPCTPPWCPVWVPPAPAGVGDKRGVPRSCCWSLWGGWRSLARMGSATESCSGTPHNSLVLLWGTPWATSTALGLDTSPTPRGEAGQVPRARSAHAALEPPKPQQGVAPAAGLEPPGAPQPAWPSEHGPVPRPSSPEVKVPGHGALWAPGTP